MHLKIMRWWFGPFLKCLNPIKNKIIVLGNLLASRSLLFKLLQSNQWRSFLYGCIRANGEPLWPDVWSIEKLKEDFREYELNGMAGKWFAEMMNQPIAEGGGLIKAEEICYRPPRVPEEIEYGFITCDPAISKETWADRAAIGAHCWIPEEQIWQTVEVRYWRGISCIQLFHQIIDLAAKWHLRVIGVEAAAMQGVLEQLFRHLQLLHNLQQYAFVPLATQNRKKTERLAVWTSMLKQIDDVPARWALTQGEYAITQQVLMYQPMRRENDDDIIDMCAYGVQMIERYMAQIMQTLPQAILHKPASLASIAQV